jgi:kynureninase
MPPLTQQDALDLDFADPLAPIRELFELPDDVIFMDANSVGPMPKAARQKAAGLLDDWVNLRRRGWSQRQWLEMPSLLGDAIADGRAGPGGRHVRLDGGESVQAAMHCRDQAGGSSCRER